MNIKKHFTTKRLVLMALFVALGYVMSFVEFPIFPAASFLKLDFGNVFILLIGFLLGPVEGVLVCLLKEALRLISSSSNGVGELANFMMTTTFMLLPSIVYQFKKGLKTVTVTLAGACLIGTGVSLVINRWIIFPTYDVLGFLPMGAAVAFRQFFWFVLAFNLLKTIVISIITVLLYKRLSLFLKQKNI